MSNVTSDVDPDAFEEWVDGDLDKWIKKIEKEVSKEVEKAADFDKGLEVEVEFDWGSMDEDSNYGEVSANTSITLMSEPIRVGYVGRISISMEGNCVARLNLFVDEDDWENDNMEFAFKIDNSGITQFELDLNV